MHYRKKKIIHNLETYNVNLSEFNMKYKAKLVSFCLDSRTYYFDIFIQCREQPTCTSIDETRSLTPKIPFHHIIPYSKHICFEILLLGYGHIQSQAEIS